MLFALLVIVIDVGIRKDAEVVLLSSDDDLTIE